MVNTEGHGHGALAEFLVQADVKTLIRGGIGNGAQTALKEAGIQLFGGVSGTGTRLLALVYPELRITRQMLKCSHHEHEHSRSGQSCHEDKRGCTGNGDACHD